MKNNNKIIRQKPNQNKLIAKMAGIETKPPDLQNQSNGGIIWEDRSEDWNGDPRSWEMDAESKVLESWNRTQP